MRPGAESRTKWLAIGGAAVVVIAGIALGITHLPVAPNVIGTYSAPDTAAGVQVRAIESLQATANGVSWAVVPGRPYWLLDRSTDGGRAWVDVTPEGAGTNGGVEVSASGPDTALIAYRAYQYARRSTFAVTSDGGTHWTVGILPNAISRGASPMSQTSSEALWAVLGSGELVGSQDGGSAWSQVSLPPPPTGTCLPTSVRFAGAEVGWVTGQCQGVVGLWQTSNSGHSWQFLQFSSSLPGKGTAELLPPEETGSGAALVAAEVHSSHSNLLQLFHQVSTLSWQSTPALTLPAGRLLTTLSGSGDAWAMVAPNGRGASALLYQTESAGSSWSFLTTPIPADQVTAVSMTAAASGAAVAQARHQTILWSTVNGGRKWKAAQLHLVKGPTPLTNGVNGQ